jgi:ankyrin repeat protein
MIRIATALILFLSSSTVAFAGPLHEATRNGNREQVRSLIDAGADLDAQGDNGETPLITAIIEGHVLVASLLIDRGADIQARNKGGFTPLHAAAYANAVDIAEQLLDRGADVKDQMNKAGVTPLSVASEEGHPGLVKVLIDHGADLEVEEQNGYTPLTRALWRGRKEVVVLLQKSGAKCQSVEILEGPAYSECIAGQP